MNDDAIIEMTDVQVPTRRNLEQVSVASVNWTVRPQELWVVGGPQGSGKSDLIFLLGGLTKPLDGCFRLFGQDMAQRFGDEFLPSRLKLGLVFDDARLFNHLTIAENVSLPAQYHNDLYAEEAAGLTTALLCSLGLTEFAHVTPGNVPRHWRRRAALARALAVRPEVLVLENPLRGLDTRHASWWIEFVYQLWRGHELMRGTPMTVVLSTDEFRPWRLPRANFATLDERAFTVHGSSAPDDELAWPEIRGGD